jgi:hypothetical protein
MRIFVLPLLLFVFSCSINRKKNLNEDVVLTAVDTITSVDLAGADYTKKSDIDFVKIDTVEILNEVYTISFKGTEVFNKNGKQQFWGYPFGSRLLVINDSDPLLAVVSAPYRQNTYPSVFYVKRQEVGTETEIPLNNYYLNLTYENCKLFHGQIIDENSYWEDNEAQADTNYEKNFDSNNYTNIEINSVNKEQFNKMLKSSQKLFSANNAIKKANGIIMIGSKQFVDTKENLGYSNSYEYLGEYKFLNAYVLLYICTECESYSYEVVNKTTGDIIQTFEGFPHYSPDNKTVLSVEQLFSDSPTIVTVSKTPNTEIYAKKEFGSWIPVGESFWGADGNFYTQAIPYVTADAYYNEKEKRDKKQYNFRYLRIKIKGPTRFTEQE